MTGGALPELNGRWALAREGGLLPPLGLLHKTVHDGRGATRLGRWIALPFRVRQGERGPEIVYAGPLGVLRDRLTRRADGGWEGEATLLGLRIGRFTMSRAEAPPGDPS